MDTLNNSKSTIRRSSRATTTPKNYADFEVEDIVGLLHDNVSDENNTKMLITNKKGKSIDRIERGMQILDSMSCDPLIVCKPTKGMCVTYFGRGKHHGKDAVIHSVTSVTLSEDTSTQDIIHNDISNPYYIFTPQTLGILIRTAGANHSRIYLKTGIKQLTATSIRCAWMAIGNELRPGALPDEDLFAETS